MSQTPERGYAFSDTFPIESIEPGLTVFVAGPSLSPAEELATALVADGCRFGDGSLFIATNQTSERVLSGCDRMYPDFEFGRSGVIDCSGQESADSAYDAPVSHISTQRDLTGIGMKFSALYESLYAASDGHVRTAFVSLSSLSMYVDLRKLFRFVHTLSGRIDSADGLGVFALDPSTHDDRTVNVLSQVADGRIDVRESEEADGELRVRGLPGQPEGWQQFTLPGR
jgi:KaiC/GvpD/RAD55 family RecA-like ATPase